MSNKIDYDSFFNLEGTSASTKKLTKRDLVVQQAMTFASTDELTTEIENRLYPDSKVPPTGLESFKTGDLIDELCLRAQRIALLIVTSQNAMTMGEAVLGIGNLFGGTSFLSGYPDDQKNETTGSKDI